MSKIQTLALVGIGAFATFGQSSEAQASPDAPWPNGWPHTTNYRSAQDIAAAAYQAGFRKDALVTAIIVSAVESQTNGVSFNANAINLQNNNPWYSQDLGAWQINSVQQASLIASFGWSNSLSQLDNINNNATLAWTVSQHGTTWQPWVATWNDWSQKQATYHNSALQAAQAVTPKPVPTITSQYPSGSNTVLNWSASDTYSYYVSISDSYGKSYFSQSNFSGTSLSLYLPPGGQYRVSLAGYSWGGWSNTGTYTVSVAGSGLTTAPTPYSPGNGYSLSSQSIQLSWGSVSSATTYEVEMYVAPAGATQLLYLGVQTSYSTNLWTWASFHRSAYYWHVRARNSNSIGPWSNWSYYFVF